MSDKTKEMLIAIMSKIIDDNKALIESKETDEYFKHQLCGMNVNATNCINLLKDEEYLREIYETIV